MKKIFSIKWELIFSIIFGIIAILGYFILTDDILGCIMEVILVFMFTSMLIVYKDFKKARKLLKENL